MKRADIRHLLRSTTALDAAIVDIIREAARGLNTMIITYQDSKGIVTDREVEPYEIKDGKLWAFCLGSQGIRQFTIGQIIHIHITNTKYRPRWAVKIL